DALAHALAARTAVVGARGRCRRRLRRGRGAGEPKIDARGDVAGFSARFGRVAPARRRGARGCVEDVWRLSGRHLRVGDRAIGVDGELELDVTLQTLGARGVRVSR